MADIQTHLNYKPLCTPTLALLKQQSEYEPPYKEYEMGREGDEIKEKEDLSEKLTSYEGPQMINDGSYGCE